MELTFKLESVGSFRFGEPEMSFSYPLEFTKAGVRKALADYLESSYPYLTPGSAKSAASMKNERAALTPVKSSPSSAGLELTPQASSSSSDAADSLEEIKKYLRGQQALLIGLRNTQRKILEEIKGKNGGISKAAQAAGRAAELLVAADQVADVVDDKKGRGKKRKRDGVDEADKENAKRAANALVAAAQKHREEVGTQKAVKNLKLHALAKAQSQQLRQSFAASSRSPSVPPPPLEQPTLAQEDIATVPHDDLLNDEDDIETRKTQQVRTTGLQKLNVQGYLDALSDSDYEYC